jgi:phosphoribosylglycinamide formyltransferase-1
MCIELDVFCENIGLNLVITTKANLFRELQKLSSIEYILLATGNIVQEEIAVNYKVINSHPGYLPVIKGLDALKWAILLKENIGVTTHFINAEVDGGVIIERKLVPVYYEDTFHNVAYRQYEMEVDMLVNSIRIKPDNIPIQESKFETFRRMPHRLEHRMLKKFEELREEAIFRTEQMYKMHPTTMV